MYSQALPLTLSTLLQYQNYPKRQPKSEIDLHLLLGSIYIVQSRYPKAEKSYHNAQSIYNEFKNTLSSNIQARIYNDLALLKRIQNANLEALSYYQEIVIIRTRLFHEYHSSLQKTYLNLSNCYYELKQFDKALAYQRKSLSIYNPSQPGVLYSVYNNIGKTYLALNKQDSAFLFIHKAIPKSTSKNNKLNKMHIQWSLATLYNNTNNIKQAISSYKKCINIPFFIEFKNHTALSKLNLNLAYIYKDIGKYKDAIMHIQKAYDANIYDSQVLDNPLMLKIIDLYLYLINHSNISEIQSHTWLLNKSNEIVTDILSKLNLTIDKYNVVEKYRSICINGILIYYKLYQHTNDERYLAKAFELSEYNKAVLLSNQTKQHLENTQIKQDSNYFKKQRILSDISLAEHKWRNAQKTNDHTKIEQSQQQLFKLNQQYQNLFDHTNFKFQPVNVETIQTKLDSKTMLLSYFYGEKNLYTFSVTKESIHLNIQPLSFEYEIEDLTKTIAILGDSKANYRMACHRFDTTAYRVYKKIIPPLNKENIIIIPDGQLNYLPFEALTTDITPHNNTYGYHQLNYLVLKKVISYAYSATSYYYQQFEHNNQSNARILGFAPSYDNHKHLPRLRANIDEIAFLQNKFRGQFYYYNTATKQNYINESNNFNIIHLATHGYADNNNQQQPQLFFANTETDSNASSTLLAHEILKQSLNSDFIVLSACQTAIGYWQKGESVMSLARNFAYTGSPSLLTTLWQINDRSSNLLIQNFYNNLNNSTKSKALQQAKHDYIQNASAFRAHPYFWAGYILIGNTSALSIDSSSSINLWYIAPLLFSFLYILVFFFLKSRVNKHNFTAK